MGSDYEVSDDDGEYYDEEMYDGTQEDEGVYYTTTFVKPVYINTVLQTDLTLQKDRKVILRWRTLETTSKSPRRASGSHTRLIMNRSVSRLSRVLCKKMSTTSVGYLVLMCVV